MADKYRWRAAWDSFLCYQLRELDDFFFYYEKQLASLNISVIFLLLSLHKHQANTETKNNKFNLQMSSGSYFNTKAESLPFYRNSPLFWHTIITDEIYK